MTLGIIDVGTNSIHLLIGILGFNGKFHVILKERDLTRLGEGGLANGKLTRRAIARAMAVLRRYRAILKRCNVDHVEAVATSAVRDAKNGRAFVRRVRAALRLPLRIISGRREARLIYLGVLHSQRFRRPTVVVTIGGGSAQVMYGDGARLRYAASVPLGGARLAQRFIHADPPTPRELGALIPYVQRVWRPVTRRLSRHRWRRALGSSATIAQLAMAAYWQQHHKRPRAKQSLILTRRALRELTAWLATSTAKERIQLPGLDPRREDLALTTAVTLLVWMEGCRVSTLRYAPGSLREGLVMDYLIRHHQRQTQRFESPLPDLIAAMGAPQ